MQAGENYIAMLEEMQRGIANLVPGLQWHNPRPQLASGGSFCGGQYANIPGAKDGDYDTGGATQAVPDAIWPRVLAAVTDIAKRHGFTTVKMTIDQPGRHETTIADQYGSTVELGSITGTSLGVSGACFLDATNHLGTPS